MKNYLAGVGVLACTLLGSVEANATPGWVQIPGGAATQIAVGASDNPIILDLNGYIQYLGKPAVGCGGGICVEGPRQWVFSQAQYADGLGETALPPVRMSRIAADLLGRAWSLDTTGGLWVGWGNMVDGSVLTQLSSGIAVCASSLAPGLMQATPSQWNHVFPVRLDWAWWVDGTTRRYSPTYITGCASPSVSSTTFTLHVRPGLPIFTSYTSSGWQQLNDNELQVAFFTVDGSNTRIPWVRARGSSGIITAWAAVNGPWVAAPPPQNLSITYLTDHYAVAGNRVWFWNGSPYGDRANPAWSEVANSSPPAGSTIKEIAYSWPVWGTAEGQPVGPSHLYMVDSESRIWQYGEVGQPPK